MESPEELVAVSDPGEVGRAEHNRGDRFVVFLSNIAAWLFPILMLAITAQVILRNSGMNQAWLDDLQWWLYGAAVLMGVGYAVTTDSHVRVDILYDGFPSEKKTRINIFAIGWLFLPFIILSWDVTYDYALSSVRADEGSDSPNGLHNLWILKVFMNAAFVFIGIACWSAIVRNIKRLHPPKFWRQMWGAFPATFLLINLAIYYGLYGVMSLLAEEGATSRDISRGPAFGELEFGNYEITYTVIAALIITPILILVLRAMDSSRKTGG
ncbi:TRAP-type mannitol/chloroaromatic compound transport system permease small subunit [Yoonia maricola]|uniref:TRAP transporter small permease protein n=1 Tax=Yoonia maricola TaxID=420999 RepID=A0A2M8WP30_9RHOB|nr:TRAP transporter small permease subunit [Yoonia maricola]PJI92687.1 TRAP-type mannitol/chloroaromatic compound transport system permease small subunit [Yoonia maricola]